MKYRYDLELLKGYRISFILLYHNDIAIFKYGYMGVVIFINIAGYISSLKTPVSFIISIYNRFKRLTPSYYFLLIVTSLYLINQNLINYNDEVDLTCAFSYIYNFRLMHNGNNYFLKENKSLFNHLWYVCVIFQLYVIHTVLSKIVTNKYIYYGLVLFSFFIDFMYECYSNNKTYYYNTLTRIWYYFLPLCLKCYVYMNLNIIIVLIVIVIIQPIFNIFFSIVLLSIISNNACGNDRCKCDDILLNRIFLFLGKISYSLYLFHFIFCNIINDYILHRIIYSTLAAILDYYIIEKSIKKYIKMFYILIILSTMYIISKINTTLRKKKMDDNIKIVKKAKKASSLLWCSHCHIKIKNILSENNILLVGDSHLEQWIPAMLPYTKKYGIMMHYYYIHLHSDNYELLHNKYFNKINIKWMLVILSFVMTNFKSNNKNEIKYEIIKMIQYYNAFIPKVLYIEDSPALIRNNLCLQCYEKHNKLCYAVNGINCTIYERIIPQMNNTYYISFNDKICNKNICQCITNSISIYDTISHLSPLYTSSFYNYFNDIFSNIFTCYKISMKKANICNFYVYGKYYYRPC